MNDLIRNIALSDAEFEKIKNLIYRLAGISLSSGKKTLIVSRLSKRLRYYGLQTFREYYELVTNGANEHELQVLIDSLTTNETYFFREAKHFEFLREHVTAQNASSDVRIWSAACSSGEEPYTLAIELSETLGKKPWEIFATDINRSVVESAKKGVFVLERCRHVSKEHMGKYFLQGVRSQCGTVMVKSFLKERIQFERLNLLDKWPYMEKYDAIFLRNIMIYFDTETKRNLVDRMVDQLKVGGCFFVGHSETLNGITSRLKAVKPSIYQLK